MTVKHCKVVIRTIDGSCVSTHHVKVVEGDTRYREFDEVAAISERIERATGVRTIATWEGAAR